MDKKLLKNYRSNRRLVERINQQIADICFQDASSSIDIVKGSSHDFPYIAQRYSVYSQDKDMADIIKRLINDLEVAREPLLQDMRAVEEFINGIQDITVKEIIILYYCVGDKKPSQEEIAEKIGYTRGRISQLINKNFKD